MQASERSAGIEASKPPPAKCTQFKADRLQTCDSPLLVRKSVPCLVRAPDQTYTIVDCLGECSGGDLSHLSEGPKAMARHHDKLLLQPKLPSLPRAHSEEASCLICQQ